MDLKKVENRVGEDFFVAKLSSGLTLIMNPKRGFSKTVGVFGVRFGSADSVLPGEGGDDSLLLPDGTAHFLEHKLFEDREGDVSDRFAANGALCNASTGFTTTSYMFSCTGKSRENLELLLSFVQTPYFTEELVGKEQGIIEQEIRMYEDDPGWIVFFNLMSSLYRDHPVRNNIAGTVESISRITPGFLEQCYRAAYRPGNMVLVVAGCFDPDDVGALASRDAESRPVDTGGLIPRSYSESDVTPGRRSVSAEMVVFKPKMLIGFKESVMPSSGREMERIEIATQIILDILLSRSSPRYESLYSEGLIDDTFSAYYSNYGDFGFSLLGADTKEPERLRDSLLAVFEEAARKGIGNQDFERIKNKYVGNFIRMFNSVESSAYSAMGCFFRKLTPFDLIEVVRELTLEELNERVVSHFDPERMAVSVVMPMKEKK